MLVLTISDELIELQSFEWLNCLDISDIIYANMQIMAYM